VQFKIRTWGGLGDVLLLTPALRTLKRQDPRAHVTIHCVSRKHFEILKHNPHVDVLKIAGPAGHLGAMLLRQVRAFLGLHVARGHEFGFRAGAVERRFVAWLNRPREVRQVDMSHAALPSLSGRPAAVLYAETLGIAISDTRQDVWLTADEQQSAEAFMRQYVNPVILQITPKTSANKRWPLERWQTVVQRNPHVTFLQIGLPDEPLLEGTIDLRTCSIRRAFALIQYATCLVGIDSVLAHAASAVGTPAIVLFGPTEPEVWAHTNTVAITRRLRCSPCVDTLGDSRCPYGNTCLTGIDVSGVEAALHAYVGPPAMRGPESHPSGMEAVLPHA
jgi:ADP-heptose:LPS heptosyltransferase